MSYNLRRVIWGLLIAVGIVIAVVVKWGLDADTYISRCLDETSGIYIDDAVARKAACK